MLNFPFKNYLLAVLLLCCGTCSRAQGEAYTVYKRIFTQEDGLPVRDITCAIQDSRGFMWFGTRSGLCRYDGYKFIVFTKKSHGLKSNRIMNLTADDSLGLIITYGDPWQSSSSVQSPDVMNINSFELLPLKKHYPSLPFNSETVIANGNAKNGDVYFITKKPNRIWSYTSQSGFKQLFKNNRALDTASLDDAYCLRADAGKCLMTTSNGNVIMIVEKDVFFTRHMTYGLIANTDEGYALYGRDIQKSVVDSFYILNKELRQRRLDVLGEHKNEWKPADIISFCSSPNDNTSVLNMVNGAVLLYHPQNGLIRIFQNNEDRQIRSIHVQSYYKDKQGCYWFCTNEGLFQVKVKKKLFNALFPSDVQKFASNTSARGIYSDANIMCASLGDYVAIKEKADTVILKQRNNFSIVHTPTGFLLGSFKLRWFDLKTHTLKVLSESANREIWSMLQLNNDRLLLGCTSGLDVYSISENLIRPANTGNFPKPQLVYKIFRNREHQLWAVADNGLYILSDDGTTVIDYYGEQATAENRKLPCPAIHDVYEDKDGICWIATNQDGLYRWDRKNNSFRGFGTEHGFLSTVIYCIQEDRYNNLWLSTDFGIIKFNKATERVKTYTEHDGISHNEFNRSSQFMDTAGTIYFGGINGITSFRPEDFLTDTLQVNYPLTITSFQWFDESSDMLEDISESTFAKNEIVMRPEIKFMTLSFSLLDFEEGIKHNYAYKIEGLDKEWNALDENTLRLSNLPYGNYVLRIKAQTSSGYWNEQQIAIPLKVLMPFYKTWWFIFLLIIVTVSLIALGFYAVYRQRIRYYRKTEEFRLQLASDLHDEVGGLLNKTAMQAEIAKSKVSEDTQKLLDRIALNCRNAMSGMRDIMWNLDSRNDSTAHLLDRLKEYSLHMLSDQYDHSIQAEAMEQVSMAPEVRQAIYLICKEAINNIVKHSKGGTVEIVLSVDNRMIALSVFNEGTFIEKQVSTGQGLRNMKMRAEKAGGHFRMETHAGVRIIVQMPLQPRSRGFF